MIRANSINKSIDFEFDRSLSKHERALANDNDSSHS